MAQATSRLHPEPSPRTTLSKAVVRVAQALDLTQSGLAEVLGVSRATASRLCGGEYLLDPGRRKEWELSVLLVRMYRSLVAIVGDDHKARLWFHGLNHGLGGKPIDLVSTTEGLVRTLQYLDASRGRI